MNKLHRRIQRNHARYIATLCATILTTKKHKHLRQPWTQAMTKEQYEEYSTSGERARDAIFDKLRNEWYTAYAQTPLQMAHELPKAKKSRLSKIARFIRPLESDTYIRVPQRINQQKPWGGYFCVKFPMVLFNCGENIFDLATSVRFESHYVDWQNKRYAEMQAKESGLK